MKIKILYLVFAFAVLTSAGAVQGKSHTPINCACYAWSTACLSMTTNNSCVFSDDLFLFCDDCRLLSSPQSPRLQITALITFAYLCSRKVRWTLIQLMSTFIAACYHCFVAKNFFGTSIEF